MRKAIDLLVQKKYLLDFVLPDMGIPEFLSGDFFDPFKQNPLLKNVR